MALSDPVVLTSQAARSTARSGPTRLLGTVAVLTMALAGCRAHSSHPAVAKPSGLFDNQNQATLGCLAHQGQQPGPLYTAGAQADTGHVLQMMQYYTSNGTKPFCDGAKPTAFDLDWARLYVSLGGQAAKVRAILASP